MKKLVVTIALLAAAAYSYGQGTVGLGNSGFLVSYKADASSTAVQMPVQTSGNFFTFALYVAPVGTAAPRLDTFANTLADLNAPGGYEQYISPGGTGIATTYGANGASSGPGRVLFGGSAQNALFNQYTPGTSVNLIMIGFSTQGAIGTIDNAGAAAYAGVSPVATVQLGGGAFPNGAFFGAGATQVSGFTIVPVPEPATFALAGLGAAALLIFRRRN